MTHSSRFFIPEDLNATFKVKNNKPFNFINNNCNQSYQRKIASDYKTFLNKYVDKFIVCGSPFIKKSPKEVLRILITKFVR